MTKNLIKRSYESNYEDRFDEAIEFFDQHKDPGEWEDYYCWLDMIEDTMAILILKNDKNKFLEVIELLMDKLKEGDSYDYIAYNSVNQSLYRRKKVKKRSGREWGYQEHETEEIERLNAKSIPEDWIPDLVNIYISKDASLDNYSCTQACKFLRGDLVTTSRKYNNPSLYKKYFMSVFKNIEDYEINDGLKILIA